MIELNKIAFIDEDGFDFNDGESLIRFDTAVRQWARSISRNVSNANTVAMEYVNGQIRLSEK